jgi:hypothetical protein
MIEFFISKIWAFLVALVVMGVLVQGIQADARSDRDDALNIMAEELENMFDDLVRAGPGLQVSVDLGQILPSEARLTLCTGYGRLEQGGREVRFVLPQFTMIVESDQDGTQEVDRMVLGVTDTLRLANQENGTTLTLINR